MPKTLGGRDIGSRGGSQKQDRKTDVVEGGYMMMSMRSLSGTKMLRWLAAFVLVGGLLLGAFSGSLGMGALVFGSGAVLLGLGQIVASEIRGGRLIGLVLMLGGAFTILDAGIWMLSGAGF